MSQEENVLNQINLPLIDSGEASNSWQCVRLCGTFGFVACGGGTIYPEEKKIAIRNSWNVKKKELNVFVVYSERGSFSTGKLGQFIRRLKIVEV